MNEPPPPPLPPPPPATAAAAVPAAAAMPPRRKKWTEEEERTLIEKYGELLTTGTLSKMKTREKKFRPIAAQVNSLHHSIDPISFPWQWTWKDASTKVQNMRHQYLLVKQKIKKPSDSEVEEQFDWVEGITHWPNFLRYKSVFGDSPLVSFHDGSDLHGNTSFVGGGSSVRDVVRYEHPPQDDNFGVVELDVENGVLGLGLGFDYDGDEGDDHIHHHHNGNLDGNDCNGNGNYDPEQERELEPENGTNRIQENGDEGIEYGDIFGSSSQLRRKRKRLKGLEKQTWAFLANQLAQLREREARFEEREVEREQERQRREQIMERERKRKFEEREKEREDREKRRRDRMREWEVMEKESIERERRRKMEELLMEREWEKRMDLRRLNWNKRITDMMSQHRATMDQLQSRILHDQQSLTNQLLGFLSQWTGQPTGLSDHTGAGNPYLSQMMHSNHVNGIVHSGSRVEEDNQDNQFIVDDG